MMTRIGEWTTSKRAVLTRYKLLFNVYSNHWGGYTANVAQTNNPNDRVYGAVYLILKEKLDVLSTYEGIEAREILVQADGLSIPAKTYFFKGSGRSNSPPKAYIDVILKGLRQHGYSPEVLAEVTRIANQPPSPI